MELKTKTLLDGLQFPEGPRWHDGRFWFSDMGTSHVMTADLDGKAEPVIYVPGQPSGLGWLPDGRLLVVSMADQCLLRLDPGGLTQVADLRGLASYVLNDMVVDSLGRAYIGNFGYAFADPTASPRYAEIILVAPDGNARVVARHMAFPNGMAITPDGRTLIVAETFAARLTAFDIAPDGELDHRRTWARFDDRGFDPGLDFERTGPDGICLDAQGAVWVATPTGTRQVLRVLEGGQITHRVRVENQPLAAMLGGPDRNILFVCTALLGAGPPGSGHIEIVRVDVPGAGLP